MIKFKDKIDFCYGRYMRLNKKYKLLYRFFLFIKFLKYWSAHHKYNLTNKTNERQRVTYLALCKFFGTIKIFDSSKTNRKHLLSIIRRPFLRKLSYLFLSLSIKSFLKKEFNYQVGV